MKMKYLKFSIQLISLNILSLLCFSQNIFFDSAFGINARTFTQNANPVVFSSVYKFTSVRPDGKFYLGGEYSQPDSNFFVTKFKADGSVDSSYGVNGKLFIKTADFGVVAILSSGIDSSSRFFFVGKTDGFPFFRLKVIRYTTAAKIDSSFGVNGIANIPFDNVVLSGINYPVAAYRDGRLLISNLLFEGSSESCGLVRLKENGTLDSSFATNGKLYLPPSTGLTTFYTLNIQPDEKILFTRQFSSLLRLFRYNANGTIDNGFNQTGMMNIDFPATFNGIQSNVNIVSDNKILLCAGNQNGYYLYRFKVNGQRDSSFGGIGYIPYSFGFKTYARDFAEQTDGKILAAGVIQDNQQPVPNINSLITRTNVNGSIDSTFDNDGVWFFNYNNNPSSGMKNIHWLSTGKMLFSGLESGPDFVHFAAYRLAFRTASVAWGNAASIRISSDCSAQIKLSWNTLSEVNTGFFKIQYSTNNIQFNTLAQFPAAGNSTGLRNYEYIHTTPQPGNNYYKLSVLTTDGQEFIYGIITATAPASAPLFQWQTHDIIKQADKCIPAIRLHFNSLQPIVSDSIIIEYSTDSLTFTTIGKISVKNPQTQITSYEYIHLNPSFGKNYYRLRVNDFSGYCYSRIYKVNLVDLKSIIIYPVPATDKLYFSQSLPEGSKLVIFDMKGSLMLKKTFSSASNEIRLPFLASGHYLMKVDAFCSEKVFKFIKMQ
jgi:uncharacterized delta-60 repeat protein